jgi:hypothetical protein
MKINSRDQGDQLQAPIALLHCFWGTPITDPLLKPLFLKLGHMPYIAAGPRAHYLLERFSFRYHERSIFHCISNMFISNVHFFTPFLSSFSFALSNHNKVCSLSENLGAPLLNSDVSHLLTHPPFPKLSI